MEEIFNKEIWEGWTVRDFIEELEPLADMVMRGEAMKEPFTSRKDLEKWVGDNQPYIKKSVPEVVDYFARKYNL